MTSRDFKKIILESDSNQNYWIIYRFIVFFCKGKHRSNDVNSAWNCTEAGKGNSTLFSWVGRKDP